MKHTKDSTSFSTPENSDLFVAVSILYTAVMLMAEGKLEHMEDHEEKLIIKGGFYELAPLTLPLSALVIVQNTIIFLHFYRDRAKFISSSFMGIALGDMMKAQGEIVLAIIAILVFSGYLEISVFYNSLFYFMVTAVPGQNCAKVINFVLTVVLTKNVVNPFQRMDTKRLRKIVGFLCILILVLHILDTTCALVAHLKYLTDPSDYATNIIFLWMIIFTMLPGSITFVGLFCLPDRMGSSRCSNIGHGGFLSHDDADAAAFVCGTFYFLVPQLVAFACMIIQIVYIRRSFSPNNSTASLPNPTRHVSVTVFLVTTLSFFCHVSFLLTAVVFFNIYPNFHQGEHDDRFYVRMGSLLAGTMFTLPLINALLYPVIIITRKEELRRRYVSCFRRVGRWFRVGHSMDVTED